ncbi:MAG TPA: hypothetical protein VEP66_20685 [Myxococcales bacterium]|nr:hypothetical protein [Myxococcales bacterium]
MFSKSNLLFMAALVFSIGSGIAFAGPLPTASADAEAWESPEIENPASPDYRDRVIAAADVSTEAWEKGEPDGPDHRQPGKRATHEASEEQASTAR